MPGSLKTALLIGLIGCLCWACASQSSEEPAQAGSVGEVQTTMAPDYKNNVELILHPEKESYLVAEMVRPQLQLRNLTDSPIRIEGFVFSWDALAFREPSFVHLIDPAGHELLGPYRQSQLPEAFNFPLEIPAQGEKWLYLPIGAHQHLRQVGAYKLWLELGDSRGDLHRSNELQFELVDQPSTVSPELIKLEIEQHRPLFSFSDWPEIDVTFTNQADRALTFLKPQDVTSYYGAVNPIYQFTVQDQTGRTLPLALTEGDIEPPVYGPDNQFTLQPGASYHQRLPLLAIPALKQSGEYQVRLTYIVRENELDIGGVILDTPTTWPEGVFVGLIESNTTTVKVK